MHEIAPIEQESENMNEKAKQTRREYKRAWNRKNKDKVKAAQERYWNRKAEAGNQEEKEPEPETTAI